MSRTLREILHDAQLRSFSLHAIGSRRDGTVNIITYTTDTRDISRSIHIAVPASEAAQAEVFNSTLWSFVMSAVTELSVMLGNCRLVHFLVWIWRRFLIKSDNAHGFPDLRDCTRERWMDQHYCNAVYNFEAVFLTII